MSQTNSPNLVAAYEALLEALRAEIHRLNRTGSAAFAASEHQRAQEILASVQDLTVLRDELLAWGGRLHDVAARQSRWHVPPPPRDSRKLPRESYRVPILRTLLEMGSKGPTAAVLERVYEKVKQELSPDDLAELPISRVPRWHKNAEWCRYAMCQEGLISKHSPHGVWEITERGRRWLAAQGRESQP